MHRHWHLTVIGICSSDTVSCNSVCSAPPAPFASSQDWPQCQADVSPVFHQCFTNVSPMFHQCFTIFQHPSQSFSSPRAWSSALPSWMLGEGVLHVEGPALFTDRARNLNQQQGLPVHQFPKLFCVCVCVCSFLSWYGQLGLLPIAIRTLSSVFALWSM